MHPKPARRAPFPLSSTEVIGEGDVGGISEGDAVPMAPGISKQRPDLRDLERPSGQLTQGCADLSWCEDPVQVPPPKHCAYLEVEGLRHPGDRVRWQQTAQSRAGCGIDDQFDAGGCVDDDGGHTSRAARAWANVSAAVTGSSIG